MSIFRQNFLDLQSVIKDTLQQAFVIDAGVGMSIHNERARLIRNGLAVMVFTSLEAFIRARVIETLRQIDNNRVAYATLPEKLRYQLSFGAINGIHHQAKRVKASDAIAIIQAEASMLGSLNMSNAYGVSEFVFGKDKSNISADDISQLLSGLGVKSDIWNEVGAICRRINVGSIGSWVERFKQLANERHKAAHLSSHQVPNTNLHDHVMSAFAIAAAFDIFMSIAVRQLNAGKDVVANPIANSGVGIVFVYPKSSSTVEWGVKREHGQRASRIVADRANAYLAANSLTGVSDCVVELDASSSPVAWKV